MLLAHFRLAETDNHRFDPEDLTLERISHMIQIAVNEAMQFTFLRLAATPGYDEDAQTPYLVPYVTDFQAEMGLDSADAWGEQYKWGQGVHIGLVMEGRASGPVYYTEGHPGVNHDDFSRVPIETFARGLRQYLKPDRLPFELAPTYTVTDWSFYERESQRLTLPSA